MATLTKSLVMPNGDEYEFVGKNYYGVCNDEATNSTKRVSIDGFALTEGVRISVKFTYGNATNYVAINVSSTGAHSVFGTQKDSLVIPYGANMWGVGDVVDFVYDGTYWCPIGLNLDKRNYYICSTAANTQEKVVSGSRKSFILAQGERVTVRFTQPQTYSGTPTLNVEGTGARNIRVDGTSTGYAGRYEWSSGEILDFVYDGGNWVIVGRNRADTDFYGVTKLSNTISNNTTTALTPYAVYMAGYITSASLPTKVSDLTNDSGYITLADLPLYDGSYTQMAEGGSY